MSDQAEPSARALEPGLPARIGQAVMRPFREMGARLRAALWLIVAVGVIMASLVLIAGLSKAFALIGFASFVVSAVLLPRQDAEQALTGAPERPAAAARTASAMHLMADALPDPVIVLNPAGHVLFCNAPARGLFASLREGNHISSVIRTPEFLDAVSAAPERGRAVTVTYAERVPVGRRMAATVVPLARGSERGGSIL
ncbi:MAG: PAS domain-containing protein, partial [Methyloceanibacter sp.]|nr:PAS domain-containing protein [Methyloceanibacter sp.]